MKYERLRAEVIYFKDVGDVPLPVPEVSIPTCMDMCDPQGDAPTDKKEEAETGTK